MLFFVDNGTAVDRCVGNYVIGGVCDVVGNCIAKKCASDYESCPNGSTVTLPSFFLVSAIAAVLTKMF